ncbi:formyltetrahydrofolate deformylase [Glutamicibacter uratoxydans]|uniref:Formyltetrahydrofolate deformylase n=1 Tax=Glutamicibacter uratoxydans TaxID=43667 RepID=A0A4Y4DS28_GLUUR|nr:formyltetrahydrofolate deformylase [Glutamicibacter uratoxydans]GED06168.1 formyltetrahydrofolate deformylase [Glutamicibacter uratoxydans]
MSVQNLTTSAEAVQEENLDTEFVLTASCLDQVGIVAGVADFLSSRGFNIKEHQQFDNRGAGKVHIRTAFTTPEPISAKALEADFAAVAQRFDMSYQLRGSQPTRLLIMVSKGGHCLNDLLFRWRQGELNAEIALVVSNHEDLRQMAEGAGIPFVHVPITKDTKEQAEAKLLELIDEHDIDLVVLARYMQILSDELTRKLEGRAINIHHSFLPGFKGARPYHQAHDRGVKMIGATAHYVTADLDEGPIIEQEVIRVDHTYDPRALSQVGRTAESQALSRAVQWHCESRVLLDGTSTVVFR